MHSRYDRVLADPAIGGRATLLRVRVRRFFCDNTECERRTFVEQVPELTTPYARRTPLLRGVLEKIALALGGRPGARMTRLLAAEVSRTVGISPESPGRYGAGRPCPSGRDCAESGHPAGWVGRITSVVGTERLIRRVWSDGTRYEMTVPAPIGDLTAAPVLSGAADRLRALDNVAGQAGARARLRALLGVESLPSGQLRALAEGRAVAPDRAGDRRTRRFVQACDLGVAARELGAEQVRGAHRAVLPGGGAMRTAPVWVGASAPGRAQFVPPPVEELGRLLADLTVFLARDDLCPVAQVAIGYAQLMVIHPFRDGNGRVGRWLLQVQPRRRGLVAHLVAPLGLYFFANSPAFIAAHAAYRDGDVAGWCAFVDEAVHRCAEAATKIIRPDVFVSRTSM